MAKPRRVTFFKTAIEDRPGGLLTIARELKSANVGLVGLWAYQLQPGKAEAWVVPKTPEKLRKAWSASGRAHTEETGFFEKGQDKTGALIKSLEAISEAGVNIIAMEAIAAAGSYGTFFWVAPADVERTAGALGAK